ncbi:protein of unknown function (plasmid) [Shinella sp. WSC3-e]|nr:hypothetical protein SHINE37_70016 [Rhizobiaceae bacterium]CAK7260852.1 protein of unknown function [Shinella sp. WSC3-e]
MAGSGLLVSASATIEADRSTNPSAATHSGAANSHRPSDRREQLVELEEPDDFIGFGLELGLSVN